MDKGNLSDSSTDIVPSIDARDFEILMICKRNRTTSIETLAKKLGVTERSVRSYVKNLNGRIGEDIAYLTHKKGQGYTLTVRNKRLLEGLTIRYQKKQPDFNVRDDRINFILLYLLDLKNFTTLDKIAEEIHVSRTTLVNDFKIIKQMLECYGLALYSRQNKGMIIKGSEIDKRLLWLNCAKETHWFAKDNTDFERYSEMLADKFIRIFQKHNHKMTDRILRELFGHVRVMIHRLKLGINLDENDNKIDFLKSYKMYCEIAKDINQVLVEICEMKVAELEYIYLVIPLISSHAPFIKHQINDLNVEIIDLVSEIFLAIEHRTGMVLEDEDLEKGLGFHLKFALNRSLLNIVFENDFLDEIKNNYILAFEFSQITADVIAKKYDFNMSEDEIGFMALHFETYLEKHKNKIRGLKKIALICENGLGMSKLLNSKLRRIVGEVVVINTFSNVDIRDVDLNNYDVVLSTIDLNIRLKTSFIKIREIFDENRLREKLSNALYLKGNSQIQYHHFQMVINCLRSEELFMTLNQKTLSENLDIMLSKLLEIDYIDEAFIKRVKKREEESPTAIETGILLPHAVNDKSTELTVAIGVLNESVKLKDRDIRIIILMIFPPDYEDSDLMVKVYEDILKISHNKKLIDKIIQCQTLTDFKRAL